MATTRTSPNLDWSQAGSDVWNLMLDTARSKLIDVEMAGDERSMPDQTDLRTGMVPTGNTTGTAAPSYQNAQGQPGQGTNWLMLGGIAVAAGALVYFMAD